MEVPNNKSQQKTSFLEMGNGDVHVWVEQDVIHLRAHDRRYPSDPAELTVEMARKLAAHLLKAAEAVQG